MGKSVLFLIIILACSFICLAQATHQKTLFIIDSIPLLKDPEDWNQVAPEDISDLHVLTNKDSLKLFGWEKLDAIVYVFTKPYRNRPDSLLKIPGLKQMEMINEAWHLHGQPYTGKYKDYYNSGRIQNEGTLLNGKLNGTLTVYFKNGNEKSVAYYENGVLHGVKSEYYPTGNLMQDREYVYGKTNRKGKSYFINGQVQQEIKFKNKTAYDTSLVYFSSGKLKAMSLIKNEAVVLNKKDRELNYYTHVFNLSIHAGDLEEANKSFYKIWRIDSTSEDTYFKEGMILLKERRFQQAIAAFDKALQIEPLLREALLQRGIARLSTNHFIRTKTVPADDKQPILLSLDDLLSAPAEEQEKICSDLLKADALDFSEYYVRKSVPEAIFIYCRKKTATGL